MYSFLKTTHPTPKTSSTPAHPVHAYVHKYKKHHPCRLRPSLPAGWMWPAGQSIFREMLIFFKSHEWNLQRFSRDDLHPGPFSKISPYAVKQKIFKQARVTLFMPQLNVSKRPAPPPPQSESHPAVFTGAHSHMRAHACAHEQRLWALAAFFNPL